jgi:hypothetical protein
MFMKDWSCFLFLDPRDEVGSSVVQCSFVLLVYIVALVLVFYLYPSSVRVVATSPGTVLFPLLSVFIIYIYDLTRRINSISEPVLFADGTSVNFKWKFRRFLLSTKFSSLSCIIKCYAANSEHIISWFTNL